MKPPPSADDCDCTNLVGTSLALHEHHILHDRTMWQVDVTTAELRRVSETHAHRRPAVSVVSHQLSEGCCSEAQRLMIVVDGWQLMVKLKL